MKSFLYRSLFFIVLFQGIGFKTFSQSVYRVYFTDKKASEYDPYSYLDVKAVERRIIHGLDLCDISDFPVSENYIGQISGYVDSIKGFSRWINAAFIYASPENISIIKGFPFVRYIEQGVLSKKSTVFNYKETDFDTSLSDKQKLLLAAQIDRMNGKLLKANNLDGHGVRIAILDAGFKSYTTSQAFDHIRKRNGIISTYDFIKKKENTNTGMTHGANVFSCIAGKAGNLQIGLATGAEFLLARTESFTEFFNEEENWLLAAEWADKNGADIINSSLGYTFQRYLPEDMNGKIAFVSKAAQLAVDKGILVVSSAGNEGSGSWKRVAAPGDAEGVLTVGGIDPYTGIHSFFSSYGPSWDRRLKPEVTAYGTAVVAGQNGLSTSDGTSFSSPLVAGFAACLKQFNPSLKNTELKELICRSCDMWPYFDYAHGYGVPQPYFLFKDTLENKPTLSIIEDKDDITFYPVEWDTALVKGSNVYQDSAFIANSFELRNKESISVLDSSTNEIDDITSPILFDKPDLCKTSVPDYLFYHIKNKKGYLDKYYVIDLTDEKNGSVSISKDISDKPFSIEFFYKGYFKEIIIKE